VICTKRPPRDAPGIRAASKSRSPAEQQIEELEFVGLGQPEDDPRNGGHHGNLDKHLDGERTGGLCAETR
jgi:hypothetical protein